MGLQDHLSKLQELSAESSKRDNISKHKMLEKIYLINSFIEDVKRKYDLPDIDGRFLSDNILNSLNRNIDPHEVHSNKTFLFNEYYCAIDYQYYLLGFLLLENQKVNPGFLMLHQIMHRFFERIKDTSLKYEDVIRTASGATRCNTNMRFAMRYLQKTRLIKEHDTLMVKNPIENQEASLLEPHEIEIEDLFKEFYAYNPEKHKKKDAKKKKTWALSYFGFWVTVSFGFDPIEYRGSAFTKHLIRSTSSNYYWKVDEIIWGRVKLLGNPKYFDEILNRVKKYISFEPTEDSPDVIFTEYYRLYRNYKEATDKELARIIKEVKELEHRNNLLEFEKNVVLNFNAKDVFKVE
jgi:hypothetical protein